MIGLLSRVTAELAHVDQPLREYFGIFPTFELKTPEQISGYAGGTGTLAKLWLFIREVGVVVHLVGKELGASPSAEHVDQFLRQESEIKVWLEHSALRFGTWTYTQWEAYLALYSRSRSAQISVFVCLYQTGSTDVLDLVAPIPDPARNTSIAEPETSIASHLTALRRLGCYAEIGFSDAEELIKKLMAGYFGAIAHGAQQSAIISLESLTQRMHDASVAKALRDWPQTIGQSRQWLNRPELDQILARIEASESSVTLLLGEPGSGKSALLARLADRAGEIYRVVAIKADDLPANFTDAMSLAKELDLPESTDTFVSILRFAEQGPVLVLLDQLDALAQLIVDSPARLRALVHLIDQLAGRPQVHIVASCRSFERSHDPVLRRIEAERIQLALPEWDDVATLLMEIGIDARDWNAELKDALRNPQALSLFVSLYQSDAQGSAMATYQQMLDRLWEMRIESGPIGIGQALQAIVDTIALDEQLQIARVRLDVSTAQIEYLISSGFLIRNGLRIGFRHQTLYEHARVRTFARDPQRFIDAVHMRQHILRARPQFWHALNYLHEADPTGYDGVLQTLWSDPKLRSHLRMMLLEFMGQQKLPRASERNCLDIALDGNDWIHRALSVLVGNAKWFAWLASGRLPMLMDGPPEIQLSLAHLLREAFKFDQARVLALMRTHWWIRPELDRISWAVIEHVLMWDRGEVDMVLALIERNDHADTFVDMLASKIRAHQPLEAIRVLKAWLERQTELNRIKDGQTSPPADTSLGEEFAFAFDSPLTRLERIRGLVEHSNLHSIAKFAVSAPEDFCRQIWPWMNTTLESSSIGQGSSILLGYRRRPISDVQLDADHRRNCGVAHGIDTALRAWANADPAACLQFLRPLFAIDDELTQRLVARALVPICSHAPEQVLTYVTGDDRRLMLGETRKCCNDSWALVAALAPTLSERQLQDLFKALVNWNPYQSHVAKDEPELVPQREIWRRSDRLHLLRAVPEASRNQELRDLIDQEATCFPNELPESPVRIIKPIGSPIALDSIRTMSDSDLVDALSNFPDGTNWDHPEGGLRGGAIQFSGEVGELAKTNPDRAIAIVDQLVARFPDPSDYSRYAEAVLLAISQTTDPERCFTFADRLLAAGFGKNRSFRHDFAWAMFHALDDAKALPDRFASVLESWLEPEVSATQRIRESSEERERHETTSVLFRGGQTIVLPGGNYPMLRALGRAYLQSGSNEADRWLRVALEHVQRDEDPAVWGALAHELQYLDRCDPARAARFLTELLSRHPLVINHTLGAHIIAHALSWAKEVDALLWISAFAADAAPRAQQAAAELLAVLHYIRPQHETVAKRLKEAFGNPNEFGADADRVRIGLAHATAHFWHSCDFRDRAHEHWLALASQPGEAHHEALMSVFRDPGDGQLSADAKTRELLAALLKQPKMLRQRITEDLVKQMARLLEQDGWEATLIGNLAIQVVKQIGPELGNLSSYWHFSLEPLNDIVMLLQEHELEEVKVLATQLLESLLEHGTGFANELVRDLDRRILDS